MKISQVGDNESLGAEIRQFFEALFTSRYVRFLETELVRLRVEKDAEIERLRAQVIAQRYVTTAERPPMLWQTSTAAPFPEPLGKYEQELAAHMKALETEPNKES